MKDAIQNRIPSLPTAARLVAATGQTPTAKVAGAAGSTTLKTALRVAAVFAPVLLVIVLSLATVVALMRFRSVIEGLGNWAYLSVFIAELSGSAMILVPTPAAAYTFSMGDILNPILVGLLGGVAASIGELTGYYLGAKGRGAVEGVAMFERLKGLSSRWGGRVIFVAAILPVPFGVAGVWAGSTRFPVWKFLAYIAPGKIIKVTGVAIAGYYGIQWLAGPLG